MQQDAQGSGGSVQQSLELFKNKWMRHLGMWFSGEQGGAGLMFE